MLSLNDPDWIGCWIELRTLYTRRAAAKDAGTDPEGTGSHRLAISSDAGPFSDLDGFVWEAPS